MSSSGYDMVCPEALEAKFKKRYFKIMRFSIDKGAEQASICFIKIRRTSSPEDLLLLFVRFYNQKTVT